MKKSYSKTDRILLILQTISLNPHNRINDSKLRIILGNPSKATYHRIISELTSDRGEIRAILKKSKNNDKKSVGR